jgi:hypothetical protein
VPGDGEEEFIVECGVDDAEHVCLPRLHLQLERVCNLLGQLHSSYLCS